MSKLWGGRFERQTNAEVEFFTSSIGVDSRLWEVDIRGSIAHARMLGRIGVISESESSLLIDGLEAIREEIKAGTVSFHSDAEDIHSEIERLLSEKLGEVAGKLHTARSRNDQVVTDTRLYLKEQIQLLRADIHSLQRWLLGAATQHVETVLPGLTHMQHAQPVSLAHHLMAYFWMLQRDSARLGDCQSRVNSMPLGSAALAGTSFRLDRDMVARELGFDAIAENSLDAVSDRDFAVEFLSCSALIMTHLSRLSEELILWSTPEFGFVKLDDSVTTGSSIMPQKKNPDVAELIRGKVGRVNGALIGLLTTLKALPLSYNRDLQEDKTHLFEGLDTVRGSVRLMRLMLSNATFDIERMVKATWGDCSNATDLADDLVRKGVPFRQAHEIVGKIVRFCLEQRIALEELNLDQLKKFSAFFDQETLRVLPAEAVMRARISMGGTAPTKVLEQIEAAKALVDEVC